uniref:EF-hand domain-containing protein n=1 Tax=Macrostomum lignano TaxID=282301 RepID=A0A1I8F5Q9_9PLAT
MLAEKAKELFDVCDIEQKGFITKREHAATQRSPCHWTPTRLRRVRQGSDDDRQWLNLTLERRSFMGLASGSGDGATGERRRRRGGMAQYIEEGRRGRAGLREMGDDDATALKRTSTSTRRWRSWELPACFRRILSSRRRGAKIVRRNWRLRFELRARQSTRRGARPRRKKQLREDMEREISREGEAVSGADEETTRRKTRDVAKERDALEEELSESREALEESQSYVLKSCRRSSKTDRRKTGSGGDCFERRHRLERETLVRQLDTLRDVNKKLKDESDMNPGLGRQRPGLRGNCAHFREGGEEGSSGGGSGSQKDSPTGGAAAKSFNRQESLQGLNAASAVIVGGETLADIMDGDEDDCEYDYDGDAGAFGGAGGGFWTAAAPSCTRPSSPSPTSLSIWFRRCRHRRLRRRLSETATMMTPCPSRSTDATANAAASSAAGFKMRD